MLLSNASSRFGILVRSSSDAAVPVIMDRVSSLGLHNAVVIEIGVEEGNKETVGDELPGELHHGINVALWAEVEDVDQKITTQNTQEEDCNTNEVVERKRGGKKGPQSTPRANSVKTRNRTKSDMGFNPSPLGRKKASEIRDQEASRNIVDDTQMTIHEVIKKWWAIDVKDTAMYRMAKKLRNVKDNIKKWNKEVFGDLFAAKTKTQLELKEMQDKIQTSGYNEVSIKEENEVFVKYHKIIRREEEFWKQRSRSLWLKAGDINNRFFHMTTMKHKVANRILKLRIGGTETRKDDEIGKEAMNFFTSLLSVDCSLDGHSQSAILENIPSTINEDQNKALVAIPSVEEVKKAVFSFDGNKALSSDGFSLFFFQTF
ncbi:uncharacterized protein LOC131055558 [Cryptomeria japonica]|uniref:uncharacterized protein LOC131055558 n=1 Tax=Cryptomeria japonica TaxID=3369 RepID=UPI0025AB93D5|nr:uncharacterized protein LOC131055558 [Cryptomeria japonica]